MTSPVSSRAFLGRVASFATASVGVWLVAFHIVLFFDRIADASIRNPAITAKWLLSALLLGGFLLARKVLRRRDRCSALVFWLLVALLHAIAPSSDRILDTTAELVAVLEAGLPLLPLVVALLLGASAAGFNIGPVLAIAPRVPSRITTRVRGPEAPRPPPSR